MPVHCFHALHDMGGRLSIVKKAPTRVQKYQAIEDKIAALEVQLDELWEDMTEKEKSRVGDPTLGLHGR